MQQEVKLRNMSRPIQRSQKNRKQKESKDIDPSTPTVTQVSLTKYITTKEIMPQQQRQNNTKNNRKCKKNTGEIPPDKRHHESEDIQSNKMNVDPQNSKIDTVNTDNTTSRTDNDHDVTTENIWEHLDAMEK